MARIPIFEPEVIAAGTRRRHGDPEKVPTTALHELLIDGVLIESRYRWAREYQILGEIVEKMPQDVRRLISLVWCDSKAQWAVSIVLRRWVEYHAEQIGEHFGREMILRNGGHNGISVHACELFGEPSINVDPDWNDIDP